VPTAFAPAIGPVLGGLLVTDVSWRWVFFVNLPIGVIALVFGALFLREHREPDAGRFDVGGFLLAGTGLPALMYALSEGPSRGWGSPLILGIGVAGVVLLTALVRYELRVEAPMVDLRLVGNRLFRSSTVIIFIGMAAFLGTLYVVALFFQAGLGLTALNAGLSTFPEAVGVMIGAQISTRLYPHIGPRRLIATGLCCVALLALGMALVGFGTSLWVARTLMFFLGLSIAHVFTPIQAAAFATVSLPSTGRASTLFNTSRQLGSAIGVAILTTVISAVGVMHRVHGHAQPNLTAFHWAFVVAAGLALVAAGFAITIVDADAAPTMVKHPRRAERRRRAEAALVAAVD
jgi:EmrB/QacA subfamily drug resistance transporter